MLKQIRPQDAEGKTIRRVVGGFCSNLLVTFTDGTFIHLKAVSGYDGGDASIEHDPYAVGDSDVSQEECIAAGLYTGGELSAMLQERTAKYERQRDAAERATFERLKAKFEAT